MNSTPSIEDSFHIAKLMLFNVRLLNDFKHKRGNKVVNDTILARARNDNIELPIHLIHQGTFLSISLALVWLLEHIRRENISDRIIKRMEELKTNKETVFSEIQIKKIQGERDEKSLSVVLRLIRNAVSHGKATFSDKIILFSDIDTRKKETEETVLELSWKSVGLLIELMIAAVNEHLYKDIYPEHFPNNP
ncbi:MAG: hypothetical protein HQL51_06730 [Magnetococcales bacterium]|nr:hypothetical protein [Magnetococcales bacterium]